MCQGYINVFAVLIDIALYAECMQDVATIRGNTYLTPLQLPCGENNMTDKRPKKGDCGGTPRVGERGDPKPGFGGERGLGRGAGTGRGRGRGRK